MTRRDALTLLDQLHSTAALARVRYLRSGRTVDRDEALLQLAYLHREIARRYRALAPKPGRPTEGGAL